MTHSLANIIRLTLLALLLVTPWWFGGVWARVQWVLMLVAAMLLAADLVTRFGDDDRPNLVPSAWLPVLAGVCLGLFQLIPWSPAAAGYFAPASARWRAELTSAAAPVAPDGHDAHATAGRQVAPRIPRTMFAAATREQLALLTLVLALFVLASIHLVDPQSVVWFLASMAGCGAALSFFGLIQRLTWNGKFYWVFVPLTGGVESFGPFVNRNNAGGFLNLCLAAGLGLLVWVHWNWTPSTRRSLTDCVGDLTARQVAAWLLVGTGVGGVLCTASRGAILALFVAVTVTTTVLALRRGSRGHAAGLLAMLVAGVALMSWAGQTELVRTRLSLMFDDAQFQKGRWPNWIDALHVVPEFPLAGTGLGTYGLVYERYQQRYLGNTVHLHAENQFVQTLVEAGVVGLALLLAAIGLTLLALVRLFRTGGPVNTSLAVAGTFGLTSQLVGGLFDFGLYIPSNAMLMAALCGMLIGRAALLSVWPTGALDALETSGSGNRHTERTRSEPERPAVAHHPRSDDWRTIAGVARSRRVHGASGSALAAVRSWALGLTAPSMIVTLLIGLLMMGCLFGSLEMSRAARIETALRQANLPRLVAGNSPADFSRAAAPLIAALPQRWDDARAHEHLALLLLAQYQCETYHQLATPAGRDDASMEASDRPANIDAELWSRASVPHLHRALRQLQRQHDESAAQQLVQSALVQQRLIPAARHLLAARDQAPTMARVHYRLAELAAIAVALGDEQLHLQRAQLLAPGDATLWFWSGALELNSGRVDQACACWQRSLQLSPQLLDDVLLASRDRLTLRQLLDQTLPPRADMLLRVATTFFGQEDRANARQVVLARARDAVDQTPLAPAEKEYTRGTILQLQGHPQEAASAYAQAISLNGSNLQWRFQYARLLLELQEYDPALEQVKYLIRARPDFPPYQRLQQEFNQQRWRAGMHEAR